MFQDINLSAAYNASAITGGSGAAAATPTSPSRLPRPRHGAAPAVVTGRQNAWTSRVPLPQDNATISSAFAASQTITLDMPRLGKSINFTGTTGSPVLANSVANVIYGSLTMATGMTHSGTNRLTFAGRSASYTITSAGATFTQQVTTNAVSGTYTLRDALSTSRTLTGALTLGTGI
jgi:hypothetical protein